MSAGGGRNVTVFHRHWFPGLFEEKLLIRPNVRSSDVEAENSAFKPFDAPPEPFLQSGASPSLFRADPISDLADDDRARETIFLLSVEPFDHSLISMFLDRLREDIRIEQPAHSFIFFAISRLRRGSSSIGTGHCFQI